MMALVVCSGVDEEEEEEESRPSSDGPAKKRSASAPPAADHPAYTDEDEHAQPDSACGVCGAMRTQRGASLEGWRNG